MPQFYGEGGVPLRLACDPWAPAAAWRSQRERLGLWLASLPAPAWDGPTRCPLWDTTGLVRHLASGSLFLGYTLHMANDGVATTLLADFDPQESPRMAAELVGANTPDEARSSLTAADGDVAGELAVLDDRGWDAVAEAPPGHVPAYVAVSHLLWDSWIHEYDLMVPRGERPVSDLAETEIVAGYLAGLASVATGSTTPLDLRCSDPDIRIGLDMVGETREVNIGSAPRHAAVVEGSVLEVVDRATGRGGGQTRGDPRGLDLLDGLAKVLGG